ncbi:MAG: HAMP domain-containing protein, partial [Phenylobacterium sp.]|nr:HAMP domain-containing protein [Phenylobacterium sp.]
MSADHPEILTHIDAATKAADDWYAGVVENGSALAMNPLTYSEAATMVGQSGLADELMTKVEAPMEAITEYETNLVQVANDRLASINNQTTVMIAAALAIAVVAAALLGWLLTKMIATPINNMTSAMRRLAEGDSSVEVPARGRKDEVGEMAEAVQVFKDAAIEKARLESQTDEQRRQTEAERARNEAERAAIAQEQAKVVAGLASGLDHLARGDLTFR